jgi:hypothetical protein
MRIHYAQTNDTAAGAARHPSRSCSGVCPGGDSGINFGARLGRRRSSRRSGLLSRCTCMWRQAANHWPRGAHKCLRCLAAVWPPNHVPWHTLAAAGNGPSVPSLECISIVPAHSFHGGETIGELFEHQARIHAGDSACQYHEHPFHHSRPRRCPVIQR